MWFFLRDWRATLVSAVALPLSAIPTFLVMHWMGFTLNVITLLSLSLVIGVLVDDAIVEIENIMRHLAMGKTPYQAAMEAADVVIMNDDLRRIPEVIELSKRTRGVLLQNIVLALGIKAVFLVLAVMGSASMWMAVFADMGASLLVVANGLRLLRGVRQ